MKLRHDRALVRRGDAQAAQVPDEFERARVRHAPDEGVRVADLERNVDGVDAARGEGCVVHVR
jgi:hypothetical protein